jgi:hypothetical protein
MVDEGGGFFTLQRIIFTGRTARGLLAWEFG